MCSSDDNASLLSTFYGVINKLIMVFQYEKSKYYCPSYKNYAIVLSYVQQQKQSIRNLVIQAGAEAEWGAKGHYVPRPYFRKLSKTYRYC